MYTRPLTHGSSRDVRIPRNYSGNAFATDAPVKESATETPKVDADPPLAEPSSLSSAEEQAGASAISAAKLSPFSGFSGLRSRALRLPGNLGTEELLILGVILLLLGNEGTDDLLLLLVLLLFIP